MEFHVINMMYTALPMRTQTEKTTFSCKDDCILTKHTWCWTYSPLRLQYDLCRTSLSVYQCYPRYHYSIHYSFYQCFSVIPCIIIVGIVPDIIYFVSVLVLSPILLVLVLFRITDILHSITVLVLSHILLLLVLIQMLSILLMYQCYPRYDYCWCYSR